MTTGKSNKETKDQKRDRIWGRKDSGATAEDTDTPEAELLAILANQVVKEEKRKLKPGLKHKKKGKHAKKKISKLLFWSRFPIFVVQAFEVCSMLYYSCIGSLALHMWLVT